MSRFEHSTSGDCHPVELENTTWGWGGNDIPSEIISEDSSFDLTAVVAIQRIKRVLNAQHLSLGQHPLFLIWEQTDKDARELLTSHIFEELGASLFYIATGPTLALYSAGATSGVVVLAQTDIITVKTIYEGYGLPPHKSVLFGKTQVWCPPSRFCLYRSHFGCFRTFRLSAVYACLH